MKYLRVSANISDDLERGWSSWNFGQFGFEGTRYELKDEIENAINSGSQFSISGFDFEGEDLETLAIDDFSAQNVISELYHNYWVLVDNRWGLMLAGHEVPDSICDEESAIKFLESEGKNCDGTGDGDWFDAECVELVCTFEYNGKTYNLLEE